LPSAAGKYMSKKVVLDASALLALLSDEAGSASVQAAIQDGACMSAVNAAEVHGKLCDSGVPSRVAAEIISELGIEIVDFDVEQAFLAGSLKKETKSIGLSLGDRACLALAQKLEAPAFTSDRAWMNLSIGIEIRLIR
jgi:ribonuclease VapC